MCALRGSKEGAWGLPADLSRPARRRGVPRRAGRDAAPSGSDRIGRGGARRRLSRAAAEEGRGREGARAAEEAVAVGASAADTDLGEGASAAGEVVAEFRGQGHVYLAGRGRVRSADEAVVKGTSTADKAVGNGGSTVDAAIAEDTFMADEAVAKGTSTVHGVRGRGQGRVHVADKAVGPWYPRRPSLRPSPPSSPRSFVLGGTVLPATAAANETCPAPPAAKARRGILIFCLSFIWPLRVSSRAKIFSFPSNVDS